MSEKLDKHLMEETLALMNDESSVLDKANARFLLRKLKESEFNEDMLREYLNRAILEGITLNRLAFPGKPLLTLWNEILELTTTPDDWDDSTVHPCCEKCDAMIKDILLTPEMVSQAIALERKWYCAECTPETGATQ